MLGLTQPQLAEAAGVGLSTVVDHERGRREVASATVSTIRAALEAAGVQFLDNGEGPGVRLRRDA